MWLNSGRIKIFGDGGEEAVELSLDVLFDMFEERLKLKCVHSGENGSYRDAGDRNCRDCGKAL